METETEIAKDAISVSVSEVPAIQTTNYRTNANAKEPSVLKYTMILLKAKPTQVV